MKTMAKLQHLFLRIREPRTVTLIYFVIYTILATGGIAALWSPPTTIEGQIGVVAMNMLAGLLMFGGVLGMASVLQGTWWLEKIAVVSISFAAAVYCLVLATLQYTQAGNRLLQLSFVVTVLLMQAVRWHRIHERPYDPNRPYI